MALLQRVQEDTAAIAKVEQHPRSAASRPLTVAPPRFRALSSQLIPPGYHHGLIT
jgi:hypothetical protein